MNTKFDTATDKLFFRESVGFIPRNSLDTTVFQFFDNGQEPILQEGIKAQILTAISTLEYTINITRFYLVGELLTPYYTERSSLNLVVEADPEIIDNLSTAEVMFHIKRLNKQLAVGTTHPIEIQVIPGEIDLNLFDAVYDVVNERWLKKPEAISPNITIFITKFNETLQSIDITTGKLHRNLIDIDKIKELNVEDQNALRYYSQQKLDNIKQTLKYSANIYKHIKGIKKIVFDETMDLDSILFFSKYYQLPETVTLKLIERYYCQKFISKLDIIIDVEDEFNISKIVKNNRIGQIFKKV